MMRRACIELSRRCHGALAAQESLAAAQAQSRQHAVSPYDSDCVDRIVRGRIDVSRHGFTSSSSALSTQFETDRLAQVAASDELVVQSRKMNAVALTLNRPDKKNALNEAMSRELLRQLMELDADDDVRAIIVTGSAGHFSVGLDIHELSRIEGYSQALRARLFEFWQGFLDVRKPVIAAVDGPCLGAGLELAMACDIVYASTAATFALPEIRLGMMPGCGGTQRLTRRVGKARAMEMILLGETMDAYEAMRYGLCTRVVPDQEVAMVAFDKAQELVRLSEPVLANAKEVINASFEMPLEEGLMLEKREFWASFALDDPHEGMRAWLENRTPRFSHK